jgi:hypothetical protein
MDVYGSGTAMALLAALGVALSATQVTAQEGSCDVDRDGYVSAGEAAACAERDYSVMRDDQEEITRERFEQAFAATENVDDMWAEADADQDGQLSQVEWADWSARRFRSASPRVEGLSVDDYEALEAQYHMGDDQQGRDDAFGGDQPGAVGDQSGTSGGDNDGSDTSEEDNGGSGDNGDSSGDGASDDSASEGDGPSGESDASGDSDDEGSSGESDASGDSDDGSGGESDASGDSGDDG